MPVVKRSAREGGVEAELVRRVRAAGGRCEKVRSSSSRGYFDRIVVLPGADIVFVETKRPRGGVLSAHQQQLHATYRALGARVMVIKSSAEIDRLLWEDTK